MKYIKRTYRITKEQDKKIKREARELRISESSRVRIAIDNPNSNISNAVSSKLWKLRKVIPR